jgi:CBS domain containing-hemolysin-like protein
MDDEHDPHGCSHGRRFFAGSGALAADELAHAWIRAARGRDYPTVVGVVLAELEHLPDMARLRCARLAFEVIDLGRSQIDKLLSADGAD